ncbi:MAG: hypothetical protein HUU60_12555 [Armatimonadetes bacterium]|nr:hypothetical protein [Armatimonadota bacterium]
MPDRRNLAKDLQRAGNGDDAGNAIGLDQDGAVYVAGTVQGTSSKDMVVLKYSPDGDLKWARTYDRSGLDDRASAMVVTPQGHCYVAGYTTSGETPNKDMTVIKVMPDGSLDWAKHASFGGSAALDDRATCIAIGATISLPLENIDLAEPQ